MTCAIFFATKELAVRFPPGAPPGDFISILLFKEELSINIYKKLALFAGGTLFGSAGIKLLSSKDAKNAYAHTAAAVLRMKDCVMTTVNTVQENAADVLATAKDINEQRAQQAEQAQQADESAETETADAE